MSTREQLAEALRKHTVDAFAGCDTACACDRKWRTNSAYRQHLTDVLTPLVERSCAEAFVEGASGALEAALHEVDDDEDAQLLARRADQWRETEPTELAARLNRAAVLRSQSHTDSKGDQP